MAEGTVTLESIQGRVMSRMGIIKPNDNIKERIIKEITVQLEPLAKEAQKSPKYKLHYLKDSSITFTDDLYYLPTLPDYDSFDSLWAEDIGYIPKVNYKILESYALNPEYDDVRICAHYGEYVRIKEPPEGVLYHVKYIRKATRPVIKSDRIDLPDELIPVLIDKVINNAEFKGEIENAVK